MGVPGHSWRDQLMRLKVVVSHPHVGLPERTSPMRKTAALAMGLMLASVGAVCADEPRPVPLTRPEMKQYLEDMKARKPRIPLPELTEDERAKLGERGSSYESRLRSLYLPPGEGFGFGGNRAATPGGANGAAPVAGLGRNPDPNMTLDYAFK